MSEEKFQNQPETESEQQAPDFEIKAEIHKMPSSMLQLALEKMSEDKRKAEKEAQEKAFAENPHFVELVVRNFDEGLTIFFKDEAHMRNFASNWPMIPADGMIIANDVKLKRDLGTDKTCNLRLDRKVYSGIVYYGSII